MDRMLKNECYVILNENGNIVNFPTFKDKRRNGYFYSHNLDVPNNKSLFVTMDKAKKALDKCFRKNKATIAKLSFIDIDVEKMYDGTGAIITGYDFVNGKLWIESKDKKKYGYDYRLVSINKT